MLDRRIIDPAYCVFCDGNNLMRVDVLPETVIYNIDLMIASLHDMRRRQVFLIQQALG